jgi:hypothetical protein
MIWGWSVGVPREPGDIPDSYDIRKVGNTEVVVVSISAPPPLTPVESFLNRLWTNSPLENAVGAVLVGAVLVVLVGLLVRRVPGRQA